MTDDATRGRHVILFLAANPTGTSELALAQEARAIDDALKRSEYRRAFAFVERRAAEPRDLLSALREHRPTIVHFSGHGTPGASERPADPAARRNVVAGDRPAQCDLLLQAPDGARRAVSTEAVTTTFGAAGSSVRLVVLNACYTEPLAVALLAHVDCVVGMRGSIGDDAAKSFAIGLYEGLGQRESIGDAFRGACAAIQLDGLPDADRPQLEVRPGTDADQRVLADAPAPFAGATAPAAPAHPEARGAPHIRRRRLAIAALGSVAAAGVALALHARGTPPASAHAATGASVAPAPSDTRSPAATAPEQTRSPDSAASTEPPGSTAAPAQARSPASPVPPDMIAFPAATFVMGSTPDEIATAYAACKSAGCPRALVEREGPVRRVTLSPFALDRTEVTNEAFARWLSSSKSIVRDDHFLRASGQLLIDLARSELHPVNTSFEPMAGAARRPVAGVSPEGARAYCAAQGKHLPTEAQWEHAARGNSHRQYPWGDTPHPQQLGCQLSIGRAYDSGRGAAEPCPLRDVATSSDVTPEGVFDLGGNVSEWVADRFADTDPRYPHCGECRDPEVTEGEKQVIRGGNHVFGPSAARAAARSRAPVNDVLSNTGFRCAR